MIIHPNYDPVALEVFGFSIRWYGIMYLLGLAIAWGIAAQLLKRISFTSLRGLILEDLIVAAALGVIIGGRLGYVLFYNLPYYMLHPIEIFYLWSGGMSFHGGLIGVIIGLWILARLHAIPDISEAILAGEVDKKDRAAVQEMTSHKIIFLRLVDLAAVLTPPGLGLGRLGNFINGELPGRVTSPDLPWAMSFGVPDYLPRHPSQLYQVAIEGFLLTALMLYLVRKPRAPGWLAGVFLIAYAVGRFFVEFYRAPDAHLGLVFWQLSMGQLLSLPLLLLGLYLVYRLKISAWLNSLRDEQGRLPLKQLFARALAAEPDVSWSAHEEVFAENYGAEEGDEEDDSPGRLGAFFKNLFSSDGEEEDAFSGGKPRLTRRQKRRLKKKKRKK